MNYQENREFVDYYIENVIKDIRPTIMELREQTIEEKKLFCYDIYEENGFHHMSRHQEIPLDSPRPGYRLDYDAKGNVIKKDIIYIEQTRKKPKYTSDEIFFKFLGMINKVEWERFKTIMNYENKVDSRFVLQCLLFPDYIMTRFEAKYEQHFRDEQRRLRNIERKKRKKPKK